MHVRGRPYTAELTVYLDNLAGRAHNLLYAAPPYRARALWDLVARTFPRAIRRNLRYFIAGNALFFVPMIGFDVRDGRSCRAAVDRLRRNTWARSLASDIFINSDCS